MTHEERTTRNVDVAIHLDAPYSGVFGPIAQDIGGGLVVIPTPVSVGDFRGKRG